MTETATPRTNAAIFLETKQRHRELLAFIERLREEKSQPSGKFGVGYWTTTRYNDPDMPEEMSHYHGNEWLSGFLTSYLVKWSTENLETIYGLAIKESESLVNFWQQEARREYEQLFGKAMEL